MNREELRKEADRKRAKLSKMRNRSSEVVWADYNSYHKKHTKDVSMNVKPLSSGLKEKVNS